MNFIHIDGKIVDSFSRFPNDYLKQSKFSLDKKLTVKADFRVKEISSVCTIIDDKNLPMSARELGRYCKIFIDIEHHKVNKILICPAVIESKSRSQNPISTREKRLGSITSMSNAKGVLPWNTFILFYCQSNTTITRDTTCSLQARGYKHFEYLNLRTRSANEICRLKTLGDLLYLTRSMYMTYLVVVVMTMKEWLLSENLRKQKGKCQLISTRLHVRISFYYSNP